jgi:prefoldin subunit 5
MVGIIKEKINKKEVSILKSMIKMNFINEMVNIINDVITNIGSTLNVTKRHDELFERMKTVKKLILRKKANMNRRLEMIETRRA